MTKPILNIADVDVQPRLEALMPKGQAAEKFDAGLGKIGSVIGAQKLGYNLTVVPPGKRAFPFHNHRVNEEMFFVLKGSGEVRIGPNTYPIREGDIVACPPGGKDTAHQIINTGSEELRYLAVSTKLSPEVVDYPDSNKFGILAEFTDAKGGSEVFRYVGRPEAMVDYWDGE